MKAIFLCEKEKTVNNVYAQHVKARIKEEIGLDERVYSRADVMASPESFCDTEFIFSTWGMPELTSEDTIFSVSLVAIAESISIP